MSTEHKRITFVLTPDIEAQIDKLKKEMFYNQTTSDMIRYLIQRGIEYNRSNQIS